MSLSFHFGLHFFLKYPLYWVQYLIPVLLDRPCSFCYYECCAIGMISTYITVCAAIGFWATIYLDFRWLDFEIFRVKQIMDCDRIRIWWVLSPSYIDMKLLIEKSHIVKSLTKSFVLITFKGLIHFLVWWKLPSCLNWEHYKGKFAFDGKDSFESPWVTMNVEFSCRSDVSTFNSSSHHDNFLYFAFDIWESHQEKS